MTVATFPYTSWDGPVESYFPVGDTEAVTLHPDAARPHARLAGSYPNLRCADSYPFDEGGVDFAVDLRRNGARSYVHLGVSDDGTAETDDGLRVEFAAYDGDSADSAFGKLSVNGETILTFSLDPPEVPLESLFRFRYLTNAANTTATMQTYVWADGSWSTDPVNSFSWDPTEYDALGGTGVIVENRRNPLEVHYLGECPLMNVQTARRGNRNPFR